MMENVLVVAAHPDDEVLGCGATIARHSRQGDIVHVVIIAEGVTSRDIKRERINRGTELSTLAKAAHTAKDILGVSSLILHDFPDNRMDSVDLLDVIKVIEQHINEYKPAIVYTHHAGDLNIDHRIVNEAVVTACRPVPSQLVKTLLFYEIPSSTEWQVPGSAISFIPNWFVDISDTLDMKMKALEAYQMEMRPWPHIRSLDAVLSLAHWRGATIGAKAAESFVTGRNLIR
jgi:N-acetylglucosamine malate deacetylase 1